MRLKVLAAAEGRLLKDLIIDLLGDNVYIDEPFEGGFSEMLHDICSNKKTEKQEIKNG
jgi:hypothetical protein